MNDWDVELTEAARRSKVLFESAANIGGEAHAKVAVALLHAFSQDVAALLYAEPRTPHYAATRNPLPTDLLLLHPEMGALLVEVKSWPIHLIHGIEAGNLVVQLGGIPESVNPWQQVARAGGELQTAVRKVMKRRRIPPGDAPWFDWIVALPAISRAAWTDAGYAVCLHDCELLFADDLANPAGLRQRLIGFVQGKARRRLRFSPQQIGYVREALGSSYLLREQSRRARPTPEPLQTSIDRVEVKQRRLSREQIDLVEAEFDGRPQLVRGVAGSGKSVVLVRNCARFVERLERRAEGLFTPASPPRVAIVCFNRALVPFLRKAFLDAFYQLTYRTPTITVDIEHLSGLQFQCSTRSGRAEARLTYQHHKPYRDRYQDGYPAHIATAYSQQLGELERTDPAASSNLQYDAIYVDESQDLFHEEFLFLMRLLRPNPPDGTRNIVLFYDDAQNIYGRPRPTWSELGIQVVGGRTAVMQTCFRNTRETVEFAFNLLLGVTAETRAATRTFADVAYLKDKQLVTELPDRWAVHFAQRTGSSPPVALFTTDLRSSNGSGNV